MSKTPTPIPSLADRFAAAEAAHRAEVTKIAATLAAANDEVGAAEDAVEDARDHLDEVEGELRSGSSTSYVPADLTPARDNLIGAKLALDGVRGRVERARSRRDLNTHLDAALALVPLSRAALPGVPVIVTSIPKIMDFTAADAPLVVLQQLDAVTSADGAISGRSRNGKAARIRVRLTYVAAEVHRDPEIGRFEGALRGDDFNGRLGLGVMSRHVGRDPATTRSDL